MKKSLFLLCFLPFSFAFFNNNFNNKKFDNDKPYKSQNEFFTSLEISTYGSFQSYSDSTNWKVLITSSDLKDSISRYKYFCLFDLVTFRTNIQNIDYYIDYFHDQFEISKYLINNKVTTKEFYYDGNDWAGYYQAKVTYSFKLVNNTIFFNVDNYVYAGWCFNVARLYSDTSLYYGAYVWFY